MNDDEKRKNIKLLSCKVIFCLGFINFIIFFILAMYLGGDAVNGRIYHGHYFLMSHGRYTEVSKSVFDYSKWHVYSLWITHPMAILAGYFYYRIKGS
jgi:hypothetical protein